MMSRGSGELGAALAALLMGAALSLRPAVVSADQAAAQGDELETVYVTAQKREENMQVVPVAVTAITSETLQDIHYSDFRDLNSVAPGVTVRESAGGDQQPVFSMRGVYSSASPGSDPGIALYVDGVYIPGLIGADLDLADIDRIEVLRGPQGTLFGRNAIAGAVNVITKEPSGEFHANQDFEVGNFSHFHSKTSVDLPAWGPLSARFSYLHDQRHGDVDNLGSGTVWNWAPATDGLIGNQVAPSTLGGHNTDAAGAALKFQTDAVKVVYRFDYTRKDYVPDAVGVVTFNTGSPFAGLIQSIWAAQNPANRTPISSTRPDAVNNWYSTSGTLRQENNNLTVTVPIEENISIKNLLAYGSGYTQSFNQLDGLGGLYGPGAPPQTPLLVLTNDSQNHNRNFQEELTFTADTHFVKVTAGYLHFWSGIVSGGLPNSINSAFGSGLLVAPNVYLSPPYFNFTAPRVPEALDTSIATTSDAVYTQEEVHILPKLDLVLGGRYTRDRRDGTDNSPTPGEPGTLVDYRDSKPTFLIGLNYRVTDDIFAYVKWSNAYISGGQEANIKFSPELARSYEVGLKSDFLDHRVRFNVAGFTADYTNVQIFTDPESGCANVPGVSLTSPLCVVNGGNAKANGVEIEATVLATTGLTLAGNVSFTHTYYTFVYPDLRASDGTFESEYTPTWTASLSAQYRGAEIPSLHDAYPFGRITGNYTSSQWGFPNSPLPVEEAGKIPSQWIAHLRFGLGGFKVGAAQVEVAGYVQNLTNNKALLVDFNASAVIPGTYQPARMYGVEVNAGF
jgi:iron complex outermembrane receptor protein